ncbi:translation initiation factor IF-2 [Elasticomyces elasticus]|nr:translation initiation factor IF-2 [Elasticomyces elasticus]KAK3661431.1 translation initiation factor IF-2 [Elasticomyces elasticus]KAK4926212.1 translation initiation factor IF-2 [Elasticomyces elasticus]KAK5750248.1 translation initiation factor IF-2 [Elasticomyces elasticus]
MRRNRYLRTPSTSTPSTICLLCACRLSLLPPAALTTTAARRRLQSTNAAAAPVVANPFTTPQNPAPTSGQPGFTFDPSSSLTQAEQAERARLRARREERERVQRGALEAQRRQRDEAARAIALERERREAEKKRKDDEEREVVMKKWRLEQDDAERERNRVEKEARKVKLMDDERRRADREKRLEEARTKIAADRFRFRRITTREGEVGSPVESKETPRSIRFRGKLGEGMPRPEKVLQFEDGQGSTPAVAIATERAPQSQAQAPVRQQQRRNDPFSPRSAASLTPKPPPRVAVPSFGTGPPAPPKPQRAEDEAWASSGPIPNAPVAPLSPAIDTSEGRRYENLLQERPVSTNPNIRSADGPTTNFSYQGGGAYGERVPQAPGSGVREPPVRRNGVPQAPPFAGESREQRDELDRLRNQSQEALRHVSRSFGSGNRGFERDLVGQQLKGRSEAADYHSSEAGRGGEDAFAAALQGGREQQEVREPQRREMPTVAQRSYEPATRADPRVPVFAQSTTQERRLPMDAAWQDDVRSRPDASSSGWADDVKPVGGRRESAPPSASPTTQQQSVDQNATSYYNPSPVVSRPQQERRQDQLQYPDTNTGNHGYRATILDPQEYQQTRPEQDFDEAQTESWQHLRRRGSAPTVETARTGRQVIYRPQQQGGVDGDETDWIDRQFREHISQRPRQEQEEVPAYLKQSNQASQQPQQGMKDSREHDSPFDLKSTVRQSQIRNTKCARCGELGHVARECQGPNLREGLGERSGARSVGVGRRGDPSKTSRDEDRWTVGRGRATRDEGFVGGGRREVREDPPYGAVQERGGEVDDVRGDLLRPERKFSQPDEEQQEEPAERVLRSRKFTEEVSTKKEKPRVSRRRDEDEDDMDDEGAAMAREDRVARKASRKAQKAQEAAAAKAEAKDRKAEQGPPVNLPEFVSVATLAQHLGVRYEQFVGRLETLGYDDVFPGKILNSETSGMIAMEYGYEPVFGEAQAAAEKEERDLVARPEVVGEDREFLPSRPPVVTIMGHVDHGKTTILDYLRKSSVAAGEAGGITQHIGAFSVPLASSGRTITFLDTPGHAAFLAMRQRGANVTDIVILVVAADDSVKPQTLEAIKHAQAAGVPMIVAVNKIDKEGADLQRVKQDLARHGVEIEDFGGETQVVAVSGRTGEGMEELEENVVTLSEILDQRAEAEGMVEGWVLEATTRKAGRVATVLVRRGTLRPGCVIVAGKTWARVRTLRNEAGQAVADCGPGLPVEVDGWRDQPAAGDEVLQAPSEQKATDVVEYRVGLEEQRKTAEDMEVINETRRAESERQRKEKAAAEAAKKKSVEGIDGVDAVEEAVEGTGEEPQSTGQLLVPLIIKADVSGSAEAVSAYIMSVASPLIAPQILRSAVGPLNESDVELADAARGHIIAFNLPPDEGLKAVAARTGVKVLENNIIYRVLDDVKQVMEERLPEIVKQRVVGEADVGVGFEISVGGRKKVKIAGCKIRNGVVARGGRVRVMRGGEKVYDGTISSLKNVKKDVQEMRKGTECGMGFEGWEGFEVGDSVQTYEEIREKRKL